MFKEKILIALKTKYSSLGLGGSLLERVADMLSARVNNEEEIESVVSEGTVANWLHLMQSNTDSLRNTKAGLEKQVEKLSGELKAVKDAEAARVLAEEEAKRKAEEEAKKTAEEEAKRKANDGNETDEERINRMVIAAIEKHSAAQNEQFTKILAETKKTSDAEIKVLKDKLSAREALESQIAKQNAAKLKAKELGIPDKYDSAILAFSASAKDEDEFVNSLKNFKQTLTDDGLKSITVPETAEMKVEKENESIANLINDGTKKIVEQNKKD